MGKHKKPTRNLPNSTDVLAGRVDVDARDLIALIRQVNPTGLNLDREETARRYSIKSRLQSLLIRAFPDEIDALDKLDEPGIVLLRHLSLGIDACHAMLAELDEDARARIQYILDTGRNVDQGRAPQGKRPSWAPMDAAAPAEAMDVSALLSDGHVALQQYDYDLARQRYEAAFDAARGSKEAATALLLLFVEHLGADDDALALEGKLNPAARADPAVRGLLGIAAARCGQRIRALGLVQQRGPQPGAGHMAEVFVLLAKHALAERDLTQASKDLARASEQLATHPEIVTLTAALAHARALERVPEENEVSALFAAGQFQAAEEQARLVLARFGDSDVARRVLRGIDEQKKQALARQRLEEARTALNRGDEQHGISLLRAALAAGLEPDDASWAELRIVEVEKQIRQRGDETRIANTLRILGTQNISEGLNAYGSLSEPLRRKVAERMPMRAISWFEDLYSPRDSNKASTIVEAIVALERAMGLVSVDPADTLHLVAAHEKVLSGFKPAEEVRMAAVSALAVQQRQTAQRRLELARQAFEVGDLVQAQRVASDVVSKHLPEQDAQMFNELLVRLQNAVERHALEMALEEHRRQNNPIRALAVAQQLAAGAQGEQAARLAEVSKELRELTRQAFSMRVEHASDAERASPIWNALQDARILPKWKWETMMPDPAGGPQDFLLVIAHSRAEFVFVRVVEVATNIVRTRITLRTPNSLDLRRFFLRNGHLILVGRFGSLLELDVHDWAVLQWCPNILRPAETVTLLDMDDIVTFMSSPDVMLEDCTISQDGRYLWVNAIYGRLRVDRTRHAIHIIDLETNRVVRDLRDHQSSRAWCTTISGLSFPCIAIVEDSDKEGFDPQTYFYDPRGRLLWQSGKSLPIPALTLVACPNGTHVFGATSDPDGPEDPTAVRWGYCKTSKEGTTALDFSLDTTAVYEISAVTNRGSNMSFVLVNGRKGNELYGLRPKNDGFEIVYRTLVPRHSALVSTADGTHAVMLVVHHDRHEFVQLDANAPTLEPRGPCAQFMLPTIPRSSLHTKIFDCHRRPEGTRAKVVAGLEAELRKWGKTRYRERVRVAMKRGDPMELLDLETALLKLREPSMAGQLNAFIHGRFAHHPRVRLAYSYHLAAIGNWSQTMDQIGSITPSSLDDPDAKHLHHMRGVCWLMMNEPEKAMAEFELCLTYTEGPCNPEELMALCKPFEGDTTQWKPEWAVLREWLRHVVAADEAFARGDVPAARQAIDAPIIWDANEVQSSARLAMALLDEDYRNTHAIDPFHQALAIATFCDLAQARNTMARREVPLPRATWDNEKLGNLAQRARQWLDSEFPSRAPTSQKS